MKIEEILLKTQAVHINTEDLFTWTSGIKSPIYCNNRLLISYPEYRKIITDLFISTIKTNFPETQSIAGTSTAGIPWAAFIAEKMKLPMLYIRSKPKGHGLKSSIEGNLIEGQKTIIIEDLISTGKSSIEAFENAQSEKLNPLGIISIFSYQVLKTQQNFEQKKIKNFSLAGYHSLYEYLLVQNKINDKAQTVLNNWHQSL